MTYINTVSHSLLWLPFLSGVLSPLCMNMTAVLDAAAGIKSRGDASMSDFL